MFDTINGIALQSASKRWDIHSSATFHAPMSRRLTKNVQPGRHGYTPLPGTDDAVAVTIAVIVPEPDVAAIESLFRMSPLMLGDTDNGTEAVGELANVDVLQQVSKTQGFVVVRGIFNVPGVFARDVNETTTTAAAIAGASLTVDLFSGISGFVDDAMVRVKGSVTGLHVEDSSGTWFEYGAVLSGSEYLRFESATGRAWKTTTNTWAGGTEVTGLIDTGPSDYPLLLTPFITTDPAVRKARLTVATTARSGSPTVEVRGKSAYLV